MNVPVQPTLRRPDFYAIIRNESKLSVKLLWSFVQVLTPTTVSSVVMLGWGASGHPLDTEFGKNEIFRESVVAGTIYHGGPWSNALHWAEEKK